MPSAPPPPPPPYFPLSYARLSVLSQTNAWVDGFPSQTCDRSVLGGVLSRDLCVSTRGLSCIFARAGAQARRNGQPQGGRNHADRAVAQPQTRRAAVPPRHRGKDIILMDVSGLAQCCTGDEARKTERLVRFPVCRVLDSTECLPRACIGYHPSFSSNIDLPPSQENAHEFLCASGPRAW